MLFLFITLHPARSDVQRRNPKSFVRIDCSLVFHDELLRRNPN